MDLPRRVCYGRVGEPLWSVNARRKAGQVEPGSTTRTLTGDIAIVGGAAPRCGRLHRKGRCIQNRVHVAPVENCERGSAGHEAEVQLPRDLATNSEGIVAG